MDADVKRCPRCHAEYQAWATRCHDCDVSLDQPVAAAEPVEGLDAADDVPPDEALHALRMADLDWLRRLRVALADGGVSSWILAEDVGCDTEHRHGAGCGTRVALFVQARDLDRAREVDRRHARTEVPELGDVEAAEDACPACGAACAPEAAACPGCGIVFTE